MWTQEINRGGLVQIDDSLYQLLVAIEIEFRKHFTVANGTANESLKHLAFHGIIENEDVLFYWSMISINWASKEADDLLKMIIEHYITVRGFSFASAFMEKFKQSTKKSTQKSKGLRKNLSHSD